MPAVDPLVSARMRLVRRAHTTPELAVRRVLASLGFRYRTCVTTLPGSPDIANATGGWAIFVHGCYWHGHRGCREYTVPKTNTAFWQEKIAANRRRDRRKARQLKQLGFDVITVWGCETRNPEQLKSRLERRLR